MIGDMTGGPPSACLRLDSSYRRPRGGRVVIGGSPLRLFTLTDAGAQLMARIERADGVDPTPAQLRLIERLIDAGVMHRVASRLTTLDAPRHQPDHSGEMTIVVPSRNERPLLSVSRCAVIIVDDASSPPLRDDVARVIRVDDNVGPGEARNIGLAQVNTEFVAFVDADVDVDEADLLSLLWHFDDPRVAVVAPRVRTIGDGGPLAAFETHRSPLDMGAEPARIAPSTRVSYVPAAVLVCRTDVIRSVHGFDARLRYGEDVDLVWRLVDAGWRCRYDPDVIAHHRTRSSLRGWTAQRFRYGTSAAPLAARHRGALAPVRISGWSVATWLPVAIGVPVVGATVGLATSLALVRKLRTVPAIEALRLAGMGNLYAGRLLCATLTRAWWPLALLAAFVSRRARRTLMIAAFGPALIDFVRDHPTIDPVRYLGLRVLDDAAYGTGVWAGAIRHRSAAALIPIFTSWPARTPA